MTNSILLIGMPWTDKNEVGELVASQLAYDFTSMDQYMRDAEHMTTSDIVAQKGDAYIHRLEAKCISTTPLKSRVVASSGEFPLTEYLGTHEILQQNGTVVVWLYREFDDLLQRKKTELQGDRAVTGMNNDTDEGFLEVFKDREPFYRRWADITITCTNLTPQEIADQVIAKIRKYVSAD